VTVLVFKSLTPVLDFASRSGLTARFIADKTGGDGRSVGKKSGPTNPDLVIFCFFFLPPDDPLLFFSDEERFF
jgi:hypothetical protein